MGDKQNKSENLIEIRHLKEYFNINVGFLKSKPLKAVDDVSFDIKRGETLGLVGESGCGKTTVGRTILNLYKPTAGDIIYDGKPIKTRADIKEFRKKATMVFQDPYSSLDPRMTVSDIIAEPLDIHKMYTDKDKRRERILELMGYVGLNSEHASRYAHEFSGGQRQRIGIARSLAINPEFIVTLGNFATKFILKTEMGITRLHGTLQMAGRFKVFPIYHPAAAIYDHSKWEALENDFSTLGRLLNE